MDSATGGEEWCVCLGGEELWAAGEQTDTAAADQEAERLAGASWEAGVAGVGHGGGHENSGRKGRYLCGRWTGIC